MAQANTGTISGLVSAVTVVDGATQVTINSSAEGGVPAGGVAGPLDNYFYCPPDLTAAQLASLTEAQQGGNAVTINFSMTAGARTVTSLTVQPQIVIYSGGTTSGAGVTTNLLPAIAAASYTTVVLWGARVDADGNISFNGEIAQNGAIPEVALPWIAQVAALKNGSTIRRVGLSFLGSSFVNFQNFFNGTGMPAAVANLKANLAALKAATQLDFVDYDDEEVYDQPSSVQFALLAHSVGLQVTVCPYMDSSYWTGLITAINAAVPGLCEAVYLQCYDGGGGNSPANWQDFVAGTGLQVTPGLWANPGRGLAPSAVQSKLVTWKDAAPSLASAFMFCGTEMLPPVPPSSTQPLGSPTDYAAAMQAGLSGG